MRAGASARDRRAVEARLRRCDGRSRPAISASCGRQTCPRRWRRSGAWNEPRRPRATRSQEHIGGAVAGARRADLKHGRRRAEVGGCDHVTGSRATCWGAPSARRRRGASRGSRRTAPSRRACVLDEDDGVATGVDRADHVDDAVCSCQRHARDRLVEQQEAAAAERARARSPAAWHRRSRGRRRAALRAPSRPRQRQLLWASASASSRRGARGRTARRASSRGQARVRADHDVLEHGHAREQLQVLEGARRGRGRRAPAGRRPVTSRPSRSTTAVPAGDDARDRVEERRLAGAVRADDALDGSRL